MGKKNKPIPMQTGPGVVDDIITGNVLGDESPIADKIVTSPLDDIGDEASASSDLGPVIVKPSLPDDEAFLTAIRAAGMAGNALDALKLVSGDRADPAVVALAIKHLTIHGRRDLVEATWPKQSQ